MEALGLAVFMLAAGSLKVVLFHPSLPTSQAVPWPFARDLLVALAMFPVVRYGIVDAPWGKRTGAHINPAVTLAFWRLGKIRPGDALGYVAFQFLGGLFAVGTLRLLFGPLFAHPAVDYASTRPGQEGPAAAFGVEFAITFGLMATILWAANDERLRPKLGAIVAGLISVYLAFATPYSGMSMNPARSLWADVWSGVYASTAIYFVAPVAAALLAAEVYRRCWPRRLGGPSYPPKP